MQAMYFLFIVTVYFYQSVKVDKKGLFAIKERVESKSFLRA